MTLAQFLDRFDGADRSIVVVNRTDPDPVLNMLVDTFGEDAVNVVDGTTRTSERPRADRDRGGEANRRDSRGGLTTREFTTDRIVDRNGEGIGPGDGSERGDGAGVADRGTPEPGDSGPVIDVETLRRHDDVPFDGDDPEELENLALLVEDGEVVAGSTLGELGNAVLFVNSDLYVTGTRSLDDIDLPSVIGGLADTTFSLRGYPASNRQKLLLVTISRFIERAAWMADDGTLRSSFQRLSRLDDEVGTRRVYERVSEAGVDTHLYGIPDDLPRDLDAVIHAGDTRDFTDSWFVVYRPPGGPQSVDVDSGSDLTRGIEGGVGLLAVEVEPRTWRGLWTFEPDRVQSMNRYIERNL
ncbi:hypothetical protein FK85_24210 [Halorubrum saccharovorum]|uniref:Histidine kinase n=1 Tax=Halorubrum saccharovorum TaxID=2248 RepID=A0A0F8CM58_9EURY|nr:hypothetical protein [Halorubrum saccharovorum]KKF39992.1 hypothetical protein FK85_24210 [Halorubrum saccharovorum]